jgi:hydroxyacylglutathione hydrolase
MLLKQIKQHGDNFSYIIADDATNEAAVIDPSFNADAIIRIAINNQLNVKYVFDTHHHGDHTADNAKIKSEFGAKIVAHELSNVSREISVVDGDTFNLGKIIIKIIHTPGHTPDSICLLADGKLFTGDTLFVGECGRTDLSSGSPEDMYRSLFHKLMKLDDNIEVYPGHDYGAKPHSTIGAEKRTNYTLQKRTIDEFIQFMKEP